MRFLRLRYWLWKKAVVLAEKLDHISFHQTRRYSQDPSIERFFQAQLREFKRKRLRGETVSGQAIKVEILRLFPEQTSDSSLERAITQLIADFEEWEMIRDHRGTFDLISELDVEERLQRIHGRIDEE